jgi:hypothetical protein
MKNALEKQLTAEKLLALQEAIQTMRKTGCFGWNQHPIGFEWPTANDLLQMPKDI